MKPKHIVMIISLVAVGALAATVIWVRSGLQADVTIHRVELANGEVVEAAVYPLYERTFLLQSENRAQIVDAGRIRSVDGEPFTTAGNLTEDRPVILHETFEDIRADGSIDVRSAIRHRNTGSVPLLELRWGMAPHEYEHIDAYSVLDIFGNEMPVRVVGDQPNGNKWVQVDLLRPVLPGNETWFTTRLPGAVLKDGNLWIYRHVGDYPDSRLVTRSVLLPAGAEIVSIEPEPLYQIDVEGRTLIAWRRFFFRHDRIPWEIRFRPGE